MNRRLKRGLGRLALMVGGPLLALWSISLWLHHEAAQHLHKTIGPYTSARHIDHLADQIVARQMNGWVGGSGVPVMVCLLGLLCIAIHFSFAVPLAPVKALRTRRLVLRRVRPEDVAAFHAILTDPPTLRYWGQAPHRSIEETARWLADSEADPAKRDEFVIERDGNVIGMIGARQWPWVTYILLDAECGKGYGGEALAAFVAHAFASGMPALFVATDTRNAASLAMVRRCGFGEIGRGPLTHETGETIDAVWLRLDKPRYHWPSLRRTAAPDRVAA